MIKYYHNFLFLSNNYCPGVISACLKACNKYKEFQKNILTCLAELSTLNQVFNSNVPSVLTVILHTSTFSKFCPYAVRPQQTKVISFVGLNGVLSNLTVLFSPPISGLLILNIP